MSWKGSLSVSLEGDKLILSIPTPAVLELEKQKANEGSSYYDILKVIFPNGVVLKASPEEFDNKIRRLSSRVRSSHRKLRGRSQATFLWKNVKTAFEIVSEAFVAPLEATIQDLETVLRGCEQQVSRLQANIATGKQTQAHLLAKVDSQRAIIARLEHQVSSQQKVIQELSSQSPTNVKHVPARPPRKRIGEGSTKSDRRHLITFGTELEEIIEELSTRYGLTLHHVFAKDLKGIMHRVSFREDSPLQVVTKTHNLYSGHKASSLSELSEADRKLVQDITVLLDDYFVSNGFWQELSHHIGSIPSLRLVNEYRECIDSMLEVTETPGQFVGAQVSFRRELAVLIKEKCRKESKSLERLSATSNLVIKIEGDGCSINRKSTWTMLSFVDVDGTKKLQHHRNHRLLAISEASESYFNIRDAFHDIIAEVNEVSTNNGITVDGRFIPVRICLGSDLKFLLLVLGLQSASSDHSCPFCTATKKMRANPSMMAGAFNSPPLQRTLQNLFRDNDEMRNGVHLTPLFQIEPKNIVPDTLHMKIRILDKLLQNVIQEFLDMDCANNVRCAAVKEDNINVIRQLLFDCGARIHIFGENQGPNGRMFSSFTGGDADILLQNLPPKLHGRLHSDTEATVLELWHTFRSLIIAFDNDTTGKDMQGSATKFMTLFTALGESKRKGYDATQITPYIHILAHHAPQKHSEFKCLGWFSSQGLEKKNDVMKRIHHEKTNKWDSARDALKIAKRHEIISDERVTRTYRKSDDEYWQGGGIQESRKKRSRPSTTKVNRDKELNPEEMTAGQLRTELRAFGIRTSTKSSTRLKKMLKEKLSTRNPS